MKTTITTLAAFVVLVFLQSIVAVTHATILTAVGGGGVVLRSLDSGTTWTHQSSNTGPCCGAPALKSLDFIDVDNGWIIGDAIGLNPTVRKTVNGGQSWGTVLLPPIVSLPGHTATGVQFVNANVGWIMGNPGLVFRTTDGGTTWLQQTNGVPSGDFHDLDFVDSDNGWIVGHDGRGLILHTADGGASWSTQLSLESSDILLGVDFVDANTGWAVGTQVIRHTTDGGATWNNQVGGYFQDVEFIDAMTGWVVGADGVILHTLDGGVNWSEQYRSVESGNNTLFAVDFISNNEGWAAGESGIILRTTDGGVNWVPQSSTTVQTLYDIVAIIEVPEPSALTLAAVCTLAVVLFPRTRFLQGN